MFSAILAAAVYTSTQKWTTDFGVSHCRISRAYQSDHGTIALGLTDVLGSSSLLTLTLVVPDTAGGAREDGMAALTVEPGAVSIRAAFFSQGVSANGKRYLQTMLAVPSGSDIGKVEAVHIKAGSVDLTLAPGATADTLAALTTCTQDVRARLGLGLDEAALLSEPPMGPTRPEDWVSAEDYPRAALKDRKEGTVVAVLTVSADGRVTDCRPTVSSGTPELDSATCSLVTRRGRFRPAFGKDGKPTASHYVWQSDWKLPSR